MPFSLRAGTGVRASELGDVPEVDGVAPGVEAGVGRELAGAGRLVADSVAYTDEYVSAWIDGVVLTR